VVSKASPVRAAMVALAAGGISLDAARAAAGDVHYQTPQFDTHRPGSPTAWPLSEQQRDQLDRESIALVRNLSPRLKALLTRVRSGEVSPHAFETEYRMTYLTRQA
jgi:hypothetical protein